MMIEGTMTEQEWEMIQADERAAQDDEFLAAMQEMYENAAVWNREEVA